MCFCMKIALEENSGSAAEPQVRPPNMLADRVHFRPPKALREGSPGLAAEPQVRPPNMACMLGHFRLPNVV